VRYLGNNGLIVHWSSTQKNLKATLIWHWHNLHRWGRDEEEKRKTMVVWTKKT